MAIGAVAGEISVVKTRVSPIASGVAIVASLVTLHMVGRLSVHPNIVMTILALKRRADEQAIEMTAVACHVSMSAGQGKTGGKVVEFGRGEGRRAVNTQQGH
jgi:hypothetical protein